MKLHARRRWLVLGGLLTATLAAAAWIRDSTDAPTTEVVGAANSVAAPAPAQRRQPGPQGDAAVINLEKLKSRDLGKATRDPFVTAKPRAPKSKRGGAPRPVQTVVAPSPSAPPLPFTYMGKLMSEGEVAVFLVEGERNLIVHEGDTIDSLYRVERIAEGDITLLFLPLNERQTIVIGEPQ